jgi:prohibitin 2
MDEYVKRIQQIARQRGGGGFGGAGGGIPRGPGGAGFLGILALGGAAAVVYNSLFNVDGGHRAIKYTRIGGVSKEIYGEGESLLPSSKVWSSLTSPQEHTS